MKIAVISDIHGNMHALSAVLDDCRLVGVTKYIFLGDYYMDFPFPNETLDAIRPLDAVFVRGNKEDYLEGLSADKRNWVFDQEASLYWNYDTLTRDNAEFLVNLPAEAAFIMAGRQFTAFHDPMYIFSGTAVKEMSSQSTYRWMELMPQKHRNTKKEYLERANSFLSSENFHKNIKGVYLFGHTHTQWHWQDPARNLLLLNPGSCGMPMDWDNRAAYSIMEFAGGEWRIEHRRVDYDVCGAIEALRSSDLMRAAPAWSNVMIEHLLYARDRVQFLIGTAVALADEIGESGQPFSNSVWRKACELYKPYD